MTSHKQRWWALDGSLHRTRRAAAAGPQAVLVDVWAWPAGPIITPFRHPLLDELERKTTRG